MTVGVIKVADKKINEDVNTLIQGLTNTKLGSFCKQFYRVLVITGHQFLVGEHCKYVTVV